MTAGRACAALVLVAIATWCATGACRGAMERRVARDLEWTPRTRVETNFGLLESPYDEAASGRWAHEVTRGLRTVTGLYGVSTPVDLTVRIIPHEVPDWGTTDEVSVPLLDAVVGHAGVHGYALFRDEEPDLIVIYVPDRGDGAFSLVAKSDLVRHELSHAMCRRAGLRDLPRWLDDGLASTVEHLEVDAEGRPRWDALVPEDILRARELAGPGVLDDLLAWGDIGADEPDDWTSESRRYALAHSLTYHLLARDTGAFAERARRLAALSHAELRRHEGAWLAWLAALDPLADLERAATSADPWLRRDAYLRMCAWARNPPPYDTGAPRFVRHALEGLGRAGDPQRALTLEPASRFLVIVSHHLVDEAVIDELARSADRYRFLVGQALRVQRGAEPDRAAVEAAWRALSAEQRWQVMSAGVVLGLEMGDG